MSKTRIHQKPEHQQQVIREAVRLLKETPSLASSYVRLYNMSQLVLDTDLQRSGITTLGMIKWFQPGVQEQLSHKEEDIKVTTPASEPSIEKKTDLSELINVLKSLNVNLQLIATSLGKIAERGSPRAQLQKIVAVQPQNTPIPTMYVRPKLDVLVLGLLPRQQIHLRDRTKNFANLRFIDVTKNRGNDDFPKADYIVVTDHTNHAIGEKCLSKVDPKRVLKLSTSAQSIAEKLKFIWKEQKV